MASCDDDFSLLDNHQNPNPTQPSTTVSAQTSPYQISQYDYDSDPFDSDPDPIPTSGKRLIDRNGTHGVTSKRTRLLTAATSGDYRKDREEWSDTAIVYLLEAYSDKFLELSRGNLRGRDWEDVAATVTERSENQAKSVEQCKNKVDNLKKRFKLERSRLSNGIVSAIHWPWFKQMEQIVGNSIKAEAAAAAAAKEKSSGDGGGSYPTRPYKSSGGLISSIKSKPSKWRRVVFKVSGATLAGDAPNNIDPKVATLIASEVSLACQVGVEVAIVVGGRNFFCGDAWVSSTGLDRCTAYQIGMMATVMNSILLQSALEKLGVQTRVQSSFSMPEVAEPYSRQRAIRHLEKGRVVIFGGIGAGMGNPLFSTDTAAALRASEIHADVVLKGTNVDCVYVCDSRNNSIAAEHISFRELSARGSPPMDIMAMTFCEENRIPVGIFNLHTPGNISRALCGERVGTLIDQTGPVS